MARKWAHCKFRLAAESFPQQVSARRLDCCVALSLGLTLRLSLQNRYPDIAYQIKPKSQYYCESLILLPVFADSSIASVISRFVRASRAVAMGQGRLRDR